MKKRKEEKRLKGRMGARGLYRGEWGMGMALVVSEDWMELCDWLWILVPCLWHICLHCLLVGQL